MLGNISLAEWSVEELVSNAIIKIFGGGPPAIREVLTNTLVERFSMSTRAGNYAHEEIFDLYHINVKYLQWWQQNVPARIKIEGEGFLVHGYQATGGNCWKKSPSPEHTLCTFYWGTKDKCLRFIGPDAKKITEVHEEIIKKVHKDSNDTAPCDPKVHFNSFPLCSKNALNKNDIDWSSPGSELSSLTSDNESNKGFSFETHHEKDQKQNASLPCQGSPKDPRESIFHSLVDPWMTTHHSPLNSPKSISGNDHLKNLISNIPSVDLQHIVSLKDWKYVNVPESNKKPTHRTPQEQKNSIRSAYCTWHINSHNKAMNIYQWWKTSAGAEGNFEPSSIKGIIKAYRIDQSNFRKQIREALQKDQWDEPLRPPSFNNDLLIRAIFDFYTAMKPMRNLEGIDRKTIKRVIEKYYPSWLHLPQGGITGLKDLKEENKKWINEWDERTNHGEDFKEVLRDLICRYEKEQAEKHTRANLQTP